jgi:hypothetical protein
MHTMSLTLLIQKPEMSIASSIGNGSVNDSMIYA